MLTSPSPAVEGGRQPAASLRGPTFAASMKRIRPRGGSRPDAREPAASPSPAGSRAARSSSSTTDARLLRFLLDDVRADRHRDRLGRAPLRKRPLDRRRTRPIGASWLDIGAAGRGRSVVVPASESRPRHELDRCCPPHRHARGERGPGRDAVADALLRKPFSPLELLASSSFSPARCTSAFPRRHGSRRRQLLLYAHDLRRLLEIERGRQALLQRTYRQTVAALAGALESRTSAPPPTRSGCSAMRSSSRRRSSRSSSTIRSVEDVVLTASSASSRRPRRERHRRTRCSSVVRTAPL